MKGPIAFIILCFGGLLIAALLPTIKQQPIMQTDAQAWCEDHGMKVRWFGRSEVCVLPNGAMYEVGK